jgi:hypothetical protein
LIKKLNFDYVCYNVTMFVHVVVDYKYKTVYQKLEHTPIGQLYLKESIPICLSTYKSFCPKLEGVDKESYSAKPYIRLVGTK